MNKKAFTLIELIGVIVILGAIALLAFPPLLNQIKNSENKINDATKKIIVNSAQLYLNDNTELFPDVNGNIYCLAFDDLISSGYLKKDLINDTDKISDTMTVKINYSNKYNYDVVLKEQCSKITFCSILNGDLNTSGSEVECGGEHFYVVTQDTVNHDADDSTVSLFAKYNLNVGNKKYPNEKTYGLQDKNVLGFNVDGMVPTDYGTVKFSEQAYWKNESYPAFIYDENSSLYTYVNGYKDLLEEMGIKNIKEATLMSYEQATEKRFSNTSYWLGSAAANEQVYSMLTYQTIQNTIYDYGDVYGVRPVIIISKESFEK